MRNYDFSPLFRSAIGFDRVPTMLDAAMRSSETVDSYPPYNIEKTGEDAYRISMAVAGFSIEDLNVEVRDGVLYVKGSGSSDEKDTSHYLHRGIARRSFERRFQLADHVEVKKSDLVNGLLNIDLVREVPEAMKPRTIAIGNGSKVIDAKKAA